MFKSACGLVGSIALFLSLSPGCRQDPGGPVAGAEMVRVRLIANADVLKVAASAPPTIQSNGGEAQPLNIPSNTPVDFTLGPGGWRVGNVAIGSGELIIQPTSEGSVKVNGLPYRGAYVLVPTGPGRFDVVNKVDIESYLKGVLPKELLRDWQLEAYKAQAITARTYALYEIHSAPQMARHYDLEPDERSQVYGGLAAETEKSRQAVAETNGRVLVFGPEGQEKIFKAYFSSCCGGATQSAYDAFGDAYSPPLGEQYVGPVCAASTRFNWNLNIGKAELTRRIRAWGAKKNRAEKDMGNLVRIDIAAINRVNRPVRFYITDDQNHRYSLGSEETRWACNSDAPKGSPTLASSFFKTVNDPGIEGAVHFVEGHGFGHGVGLCQWCTEARAEQGMSCEAILALAFPRSKIMDLRRDK